VTGPALEHPVVRWLMTDARRITGSNEFLAAFAERLVAAGVDVARITTGVPILHPQIFSFSGRWEPGTDVTERMGVAAPRMSFSTWFFDYDNDGWPDLFVAGFVPSIVEAVKPYVGQHSSAETMKLYRNLKGRGFEDVTAAVGLDRVTLTMGANFGDVDNDGWLDIYLGNGAPSYAALAPNLLFRNHDGRRFVDISTSSGTSHLQKGHGIAIGDLDGDGNEDIFANMGGFVPADSFSVKAIAQNPAITVRISPHGGHCAFISARNGVHDGYWAEWAIVEFLAGQVGMGA